MELSFYLPTKVIMGKGCIAKNAAIFKSLGTKAVIVTYPVSRQNGSLADVEGTLRANGMDYITIEDTPINPELEAVQNIGARARAFGADMIIGLGGGSALDSSKAAAVLCTNDIPAEALFKNQFAHKPLALITIPTTAGTGAEVTANAVLTIKAQNTKKSFGTEPLTSPLYAFLDAAYTVTMPRQITADTAVDALSHGVEGFIRAGNTLVTDMLGESIFSLFRTCRTALETGELTFSHRELLQYMAMLSGVMINHARTLAVHTMGYALTMNKGLSHGAACGVLLGDYVEYCYGACKDKIDHMLFALGLKSPKEFTAMLKGLLNQSATYTVEELERYTDESCAAAISKPNPRTMDRQAVLDIFKAALL